jgi:hypothetical protein
LTLRLKKRIIEKMTKKQSRKLASRIRSVKKSLRVSEGRYFEYCKDTWTLSKYYAEERAMGQKLTDELDRIYRETCCGMKGCYRGYK